MSYSLWHHMNAGSGRQRSLNWLRSSQRHEPAFQQWRRWRLSGICFAHLIKKIAKNGFMFCDSALLTVNSHRRAVGGGIRKYPIQLVGEGGRYFWIAGPVQSSSQLSCCCFQGVPVSGFQQRTVCNIEQCRRRVNDAVQCQLFQQPRSNVRLPATAPFCCPQ